MGKQQLTNQDLSWLSFNGRVLEEAASKTVPILERLKFLSIFSSNLDEYYRVKAPHLLALVKLNRKEAENFNRVNTRVLGLQKRFGEILDGLIIPQLKQSKVHFINTSAIPEKLGARVRDIFFNEVSGLLHPVNLSQSGGFFAENNALYSLVILEDAIGSQEVGIVNIPARVLPRFYNIEDNGARYIVFLDDIIRENMQVVFPDNKVASVFNVKITRDSDLNLVEEYTGDIGARIEKLLELRDFGLATRFLHQPGIPDRFWPEILKKLNLEKVNLVAGGMHHGLKDLENFPLKGEGFHYPVWKPVQLKLNHATLFAEITARDIMVHTPYQDYCPVLRFFNEAALDPAVIEIHTTLYRIAADSRIGHALISAALNGKKVTVLVELKARFDEANNLQWAKRMKAAGVKIIYSSQNIKVHAKIALVSRCHPTHPYLGLLATGNLNEGTARFYTDHILLTSLVPMLDEVKMLFGFLAKKQKPDIEDKLLFRHLLVAQFNLQKKFFSLIEREIVNVKKGLPAGITVKLNNLEEEKIIHKLYKASSAGVKVNLIVRGICCLKPGVPGLSENIRVKRIVDRYLEHGRVFKFENGGRPEVFMGSSDWMARNIYRRIEVCFPVYNQPLKQELMKILELQWKDNVQAVWVGAEGENLPIVKKGRAIRSQEAIYKALSAARATPLHS